mmetsp:Transcript_4695/g.12024  ORF Transcript_4695/g.12024 Transcript_4695/m.12024 type:complete len:293 (+) Transcript_4695:281-1159(+)
MGQVDFNPIPPRARAHSSAAPGHAKSPSLPPRGQRLGSPNLHLRKQTGCANLVHSRTWSQSIQANRRQQIPAAHLAVVLITTETKLAVLRFQRVVDPLLTSLRATCVGKHVEHVVHRLVVVRILAKGVLLHLFFFMYHAHVAHGARPGHGQVEQLAHSHRVGGAVNAFRAIYLAKLRRVMRHEETILPRSAFGVASHPQILIEWLGKSARKASRAEELSLLIEQHVPSVRTLFELGGKRMLSHAGRSSRHAEITQVVSQSQAHFARNVPSVLILCKRWPVTERHACAVLHGD